MQRQLILTNKKIPSFTGLVIFYIAITPFLVNWFEFTLVLSAAYLGYRWLLFSNLPKILFLPFLLGISPIFFSVLEAELLDSTVNDVYGPFGNYVINISILSIILVLIGTKICWRYYLKRSIPFVETNKTLLILDKKNLLKLYYIFFLISQIVDKIAFKYPGYTQIIIRISEIRYILFTLYVYYNFKQNLNKRPLFFILAIETIAGLFSYFSNFKTIYFYFVTGLILSRPKFNIKQIFFISIISLSLIYLLLFWQSVKPQYREFVSKGEISQNFSVTKMEAIKFLWSENSQVDLKKFNFINALERIGYIRYFCLTVENVNNHNIKRDEPFLLQTLKFICVPRLFFPDKPEKDDSKKTSILTGMFFSGKESATSFSVGHFAEIYYDFGVSGLVIYSLLLGFLEGFLLFIIFTKTSFEPIYKLCLATVLLSDYISYGSDSIVFIGGLIYGCIVHLLIFNLGHTFLNNQIFGKKNLKFRQG